MVYSFNGKEYKTLQAFFIAECPTWTAEASWDGSIEEIALCDSVNCIKNLWGINPENYSGHPEILKVHTIQLYALLEQLKEKHDYEVEWQRK